MSNAEIRIRTPYPAAPCGSVTKIALKDLEKYDPRDAGALRAGFSLILGLGHSMGGVMTHTLISDSGYKLWDRVISVRPEMFFCDPKTSRVVNAIFLFERENRVRRAILISVPHRGSPIADNWIGSLG
jgi:triacylglycerol esterase/lipase EstA (alpha/beta hydrolase family)